jgi:hypothetical protein
MVDSLKSPAQERNLKSINLIGPNGDISKKDLRVVKQRFLNLHKLKMQRALDAITPRQKIFKAFGYNAIISETFLRAMAGRATNFTIGTKPCIII